MYKTAFVSRIVVGFIGKSEYRKIVFTAIRYKNTDFFPKRNTPLVGVFAARLPFFLQRFRQSPRLHVVDAPTQRRCQVVERNKDLLETVGNGLGIPQVLFHERLQCFRSCPIILLQR